MLKTDFFERDATIVAQNLLGKVIRRRVGSVWLAVRIIETEAYYRDARGSHSSLGRTPSREAMFMSAGTIYMYYSRGRDSLNLSCHGLGNAVLIKSGWPWVDTLSPLPTLEVMRNFFPPFADGSPRPIERLCNGQTLLCQALNLRVPDWNCQIFDPQSFYIEDTGEKPTKVIMTTRLGISKGRDEHLLYRFIDHEYASHCSQNPLTQRRNDAKGGHQHYIFLGQE